MVSRRGPQPQSIRRTRPWLCASISSSAARIQSKIRLVGDRDIIIVKRVAGVAFGAGLLGISLLHSPVTLDRGPGFIECFWIIHPDVRLQQLSAVNQFPA